MDRRYRNAVIVTGAVAAMAAAILAAVKLSWDMTLADSFREYTEFGSDETALIRQDMGLELSGAAEPVRLTIGHGGGDYCYQLWLEDIGDPEKFMEESFAGKMKNIGEDGLWDKEALGYEGKKADSAEVIYECELPADSGLSFDHYYAAFYEDGGEHSAKIFANKI